MRRLTVIFWALLAIAPGSATAADGTFDSRFSGDGRLAITGSNGGSIEDVGTLSDGRIVAVGSFGGGVAENRNDVALFEPDGDLDASFGGDGIVAVPGVIPTEVAVQSTDKIVIAGASVALSATTTPSQFALSRVNLNGSVDAGFVGGLKLVDFAAASNFDDIPSDLAVGPGDVLAVVGYEQGQLDQSNTRGPNLFDVARLTNNGATEFGFSGDGQAQFDIDPNNANQDSFPNGVDFQSDGKLVVAGAADVSTLSDSTTGDSETAEEFSFAVIRLTTAGVLDNTFASGTGKSYPNVVTGDTDCDSIPFGDVACSNELEQAEDVEVQSDGKIVVGGWTDIDTDADTNHDTDETDEQEIDYALVRLTSAGGVDNAGFGGGDGRVTTAISPAGFDRARGVEIQPDGKILAAGVSSSTGGSEDFSIARYLTDGTLDSGFDGAGSANGKFVFQVSADARELGNALALLPNGSAVLGGANFFGNTALLAVLKTDDTAPASTIDSGPTEGSTITNNEPTITFSTGGGEPPTTTFQCMYDGVHPQFIPCGSPYTQVLANGVHTFRVRAVDLAGNVDATPATRSFTVNASPPNTLLSSNPGALTADTTPSFGFSATVGGSSFECAVLPGHGIGVIEDLDFSSCTSTFTSSALTDGEYTFAVRASNGGGTDDTPARFEFEVDTDAPNGVIVQAPSGTITDHSPTFQVSTDEPDDIADGEFTMTCELTGTLAQSTSCDASPFSFAQSLPDGGYTFTLQVQDLLTRQDASPATSAFTVTTPPPPPDTGGGATPVTPVTPTTPPAKKCKKGRKLKKGRCVKKKTKKK